LVSLLGKCSMVLESVETGDTCLFPNGVLVLVFFQVYKVAVRQGHIDRRGLTIIWLDIASLLTIQSSLNS
jgi:hypothetical protein